MQNELLMQSPGGASLIIAACLPRGAVERICVRELIRVNVSFMTVRRGSVPDKAGEVGRARSRLPRRRLS